MENVEQLLSIGEVVASLGITRRILLNYEAHGLISADVKGGSLGNRYYTLDTYTRISSIRSLQNLGLSLKEIGRYYKDGSDLFPMIARLETLRDELNLSIETLYAHTLPPSGEAILPVTLPSQTTYRQTFYAPTMAQRFEQLRNCGLTALRMYGYEMGKRPYYIEYPLADPLEISYGVAVSAGSTGEFVREDPALSALAVTHHGPYEGLPEVRQRILNYAAEHGIRPLGSCRHVFLEGPPQHQDPSRFVTQVAVPIVDRRKNG